jgi:hypothetical protein
MYRRYLSKTCFVSNMFSPKPFGKGEIIPEEHLEIQKPVEVLSFTYN